MAGSSFSARMRASNSPSVTLTGSSISSERMPTCLQPAILSRTYERDAGLSPTRMTASAGVTP